MMDRYMLRKSKDDKDDLNPIPKHNACRNCGQICQAPQFGTCPHAFVMDEASSTDNHFDRIITSRIPVKGDRIRWTTRWKSYKPNPLPFESASIDNFETLNNSAWNDWDGDVDRRSRCSHYAIDQTSKAPINPCGRTGATGIGSLKRWGPNHSVIIVPVKSKPIMASNNKRSTFELFIRGSDMHTNRSLIQIYREVGDRTVDAVSKWITTYLGESYSHLSDELGVLVYSGYLDDQRNTDNAWIECMAFMYKDGPFAAVCSEKFVSDHCWIDANDFLHSFVKTSHSHWQSSDQCMIVEMIGELLSGMLSSRHFY